MIELKVQCPRCRKIKRWISWKSTKKYDIYGKRTTCWNCNKNFAIKTDTQDNIIKLIAWDSLTRPIKLKESG